jgi:hypothetical protein
MPVVGWILLAVASEVAGLIGFFARAVLRSHRDPAR